MYGELLIFICKREEPNWQLVGDIDGEMADASIDKISQKLQGLTISKSDIESVGEEIGRGAYGKVYTLRFR